MGIKPGHLKDYIITPTLKKLGLYSDSAVNLLLGTAAQESQLGLYLKQIEGPALGIYQMEPNTHFDIWKNYLNYRQVLRDIIYVWSMQDEKALIFNLAYATAFARIQYLRAPEALPAANNIEGLAAYWKKYYNTPRGKGTEQEFINNYKQLIL